MANVVYGLVQSFRKSNGGLPQVVLEDQLFPAVA